MATASSAVRSFAASVNGSTSDTAAGVSGSGSAKVSAAVLAKPATSSGE